MRKLVTILIKVLKMRVCSEKRNIASEENDNETNIEEKETEDQDFLICVKSEKVYGFFLSYLLLVLLSNSNNYTKKLVIMFCMILPASLIFFELDLLRRDTPAFNSARMEYKVVDFLAFRFSQMDSKPMDRMETVGRRKVSSATISRRRLFSADKFLS